MHAGIFMLTTENTEMHRNLLSSTLCQRCILQRNIFLCFLWLKKLNCIHKRALLATEDYHT